MKAFYRDPNGAWEESIRDGPWDPIFTGSLPHGQCITVPIWPLFVDFEIWWELEFKPDAKSQPVRRVYRWDWEGDCSLMLREALYAAQVSAAAS